ncbi:MAG: prevent-host-death protein [Methylococcales bacterium]|nr:prevent-host-death protein [Methylococcales bacterium]
MKTLSIREMRNCDIEALLKTTKEVVLTKNGHHIARIFPIQKKLSRPTHKELHALTKTTTLSSAKIIREMRDER